jgi:DNA-binding transcriptional ArsR family regulator
MRVRRTSLLAYSTIKNQGLLSERRLQVYEALFNHGPLTRNELSTALESQGIRINPNLVSSRLIELREMGVVEEAGHRECPLTGMTVILWDVTEHLPSDFKRPKSNLQLARERLTTHAAEPCFCNLFQVCSSCVAKEVLKIMNQKKDVA